MDTSTIADAKNNLPKLIHAAESGEDIHISRHGKPVAVLISEERYQQLSKPENAVFMAIMKWRDEQELADLSNEEVDSWRDRSEPRDFSWD